ncbi:hypothetical protein V8C37DRAFT_410025 [Trichoderma ceciliae]
MSQSYDSQYIDDDFMETWEDSGLNTLNLDEYASGSLFPTTLQEQMFAKAQSELDLGTLDFLTATDTYNVETTTKHADNPGLDLSLNWMPETTDCQFSNNAIPNNAFFSFENSNPLFPPYDQQPPAYNLRHSNLDKALDQDSPLSAYPPLNLEDAANSLPYGHRVIQQSRQLLPLTAQNLRINNSGFTPNTHIASNNNQRERPASSKRTSQYSLGNRKVSLNRAAKQRGDPSCDPLLCYSANAATLAPWGSMTWNGQHLFSYTPMGQWLRDRCFNERQFREYVDNCKKETVFWVQQAPTQCNHRLDPEDRICRWANCPVPNRTITAGWLRVAFDEFPHLTSNGSRDPLKCAGSVHLWCFEQIFDPTEFYLSGRLRPEDRQFPFEDKSVVTLEKLTDAGLIREAYQPWFAQRMHRFNPMPQDYRETLSYRLNQYHLDNQTAARQKARSKRNNRKSEDERRTIDVHLGNLKMFVEITNKARWSKKSRKLRRMRGGDVDTSASATGSTPSKSAPSQPTSGGGHSLNLNTSHTTSALGLNMSSRLPSYFDPLNPAHNPMRSSFRPSLATTNVPSYRPQDSRTSVPNSNYSQKIPGSRFNMATRAQTRHSLRPLVTQPQQRRPSSSMVMPLKIEEQQQQFESLRDNLDSRFETQGNVLVKHDPDETKVFAQPPGEASQLLGGSRGASFFDSRRSNGLSQGELDIGHLIDPRLFGDELGTSQHRKEAASEANNIFTAHALADSDSVGSQPLGIVSCAVSPQVAAASESWDSLGSLMDTTGFGGFIGADNSSLFDDFAAANGVDGESRNF